METTTNCLKQATFLYMILIEHCINTRVIWLLHSAVHLAKVSCIETLRATGANPMQTSLLPAIRPASSENAAGRPARSCRCARGRVMLRPDLVVLRAGESGSIKKYSPESSLASVSETSRETRGTTPLRGSRHESYVLRLDVRHLGTPRKHRGQGTDQGI